MKFMILHPADGSLNTLCKTDVTYKLVAIIEAEGLEYVFNRTQNDLNPEYAKLNLRSSAVGDMIMDIEADKTYIIDPRGHGEIKIHTVEFDDQVLPLR